MRGFVLCVVAGCGRIAFDPFSDRDASVTDVIGTGDGALPVCAAAYELTFGTSRYRRSLAPKDWFDAETDCETDGGHLVIPDSAAEQTFLLAGPVKPLWLGVTDHLMEGQFLSVTNAPASNAFWNTGEPNNQTGGEDCALLLEGTGGPWNDEKCEINIIHYVCECDGQAAAATYCDTTLDVNCGECGTVCPGGLGCMGQQCL